jgi:hypothetical protein
VPRDENSSPLDSIYALEILSLFLQALGFCFKLKEMTMDVRMIMIYELEDHGVQQQRPLSLLWYLSG